MRRAAIALLTLLALDMAAQDRVLVPVAYNGPGALGSFWSISVGAYNRATQPFRIPCSSPASRNSP